MNASDSRTTTRKSTRVQHGPVIPRIYGTTAGRHELDKSIKAHLNGLVGLSRRRSRRLRIRGEGQI